MKLFYLIILVSLCVSCVKKDANYKETSEASMALKEKPKTQTNKLENWLNYHGVIASNFISKDTLEVNVDWKAHNLEENAAMYKQMFIYAPDSNMYVDLDSYSLLLEKADDGKLMAEGQSVDTKVVLVNKSNNNALDLLFCGSSCFFEDVVWKSNSSFWVLGWSEVQNGNTISFFPTIWKFKKSDFTSYELLISEKPTQHNPSKYVEDVRLNYITFE